MPIVHISLFHGGGQTQRPFCIQGMQTGICLSQVLGEVRKKGRMKIMGTGDIATAAQIIGYGRNV